ncbi:uncharacterized protein SRS1_11352 [Sporisorium reilianum f. sp. reilianum]|uniref:Uncharacterized protein n=1 Tax=Sporisorium reilianum f. sp. reilianum TaxID=72559 RepID=A0A2N8UP19_9BASI|nr:uncharacterized protein SRS1_11352 [Sporisorium reilianum f. sp. reilianum]
MRPFFVLALVVLATSAIAVPVLLTPEELKEAEEALSQFAGLSVDDASRHIRAVESSLESSSSNFVAGSHSDHSSRFQPVTTYEHVPPAAPDTYHSESEAANRDARRERTPSSPARWLTKLSAIGKKNRDNSKLRRVIALAVEQHKAEMEQQGRTSALTRTDVSGAWSGSGKQKD